MNEKKTCYFCTTPYQIIGAISLVQSNKEVADLYIVGQFENFNELSERIKKENIFNNVYGIDEDYSLKSLKKIKNNLIRKIQMMLFYFKIDAFGNKIINNPNEYKKMYFTSQAFIIRLIYFYFLKNNSSIEYIIFDDGIGSYFKESLFEVSLVDKMLRRLIIGKRSIDFNFKKILYMPELYQANEKMEDIDIMPRISTDVKNNDMINRIFNYTNKNNINEKFIIFDTLRSDVYGNNGNEYLKKIYFNIYNLLDENSLIIKDHPRNKASKLELFNYYIYNTIPSEVIYLNLDMNNKTLITSSSTSVITAKLLFNKEPRIILLYKLMSKYSDNFEYEKRFFEDFSKTYENKGRIYIPDNSYELKKYIKEIRDKSYEKNQ